LATWQEIRQRFGFNDHRRRLLDGLEAAIVVLRPAGATALYLDGSFTTAKALPNDFDACYDISAGDLAALGRSDPVFLDLRHPRQHMKSRFGGELFPSWFQAAGSPSSPTAYREFFQSNRHGVRKGVVVVDIRSWP
jgi:hypothetical protein